MVWFGFWSLQMGIVSVSVTVIAFGDDQREVALGRVHVLLMYADCNQANGLCSGGEMLLKNNVYFACPMVLEACGILSFAFGGQQQGSRCAWEETGVAHPHLQDTIVSI